LPRLPAEFDGYRIVQVSDIHIGDWMNADRLVQVVHQVNAQSADLIAITGDFISRRPGAHAHDLACGLSRLEARDRVVAVLGNHDHRGNAGIVREILRASGVRELANAVYTQQRGTALLHIAGVDDILLGRDRLDEVLAALPGESAAILLAHEPDFADVSSATGRFDLQISGHTHGGQIAAPFKGPLLLPYLGFKYPSGRYQVGDMIQYTNRGVGMIRPFIRFNCRPEVTVFELRAPEKL
jgi:predicted MPP superfamily phosphohydrolase